MTLKSRILVAIVCFGAFAGAAQAKTYYVATNGNDRHAGTSEAAPWRTVERVDQAHLRPGDTVLFHAGDLFANLHTLQPPTSGTPGAPIRFSSYGGGRARFDNPRGNDVWLPGGRHDLDFSNLDFSGGSVLFASSSDGPGTARITIRHSSFHDTPLGALNVASANDHDWTITRSTFKHTGDSGIIIWGSDVTVTHSSIVDTGGNNDISWAKHGLYVKGPGAVISDNVISGFQSDGVSLRSENARVLNNTIHGGVVGVAYFDYSVHSGTSQVVDNRIYGVNESFYFAGDADAINGGNPRENFVIRGNLLKADGKLNVDLSGAVYSQVSLTQNILRGHFQIAVNAYQPLKGGGYKEEQNTIFGNGVFVWNGVELPYAAYRTTSGLGDLDRIYSAST
jgi:hypothetical protein